MNLAIFKLSGLHCISCSLNIDNELEDLVGVISTTTSYSQQVAKVAYDPGKISPSKIRDTISSLGYSATLQSDSPKE